MYKSATWWGATAFVGDAPAVGLHLHINEIQRYLLSVYQSICFGVEAHNSQPIPGDQLYVHLL